MSQSQLLLGLDIGTTSAKGVLLTPSAKIVAEGDSAQYTVQRPKPGWAEQDPRNWWAAACQVVRSLLAQVEPGADIAAVSVSGQGCACTLVDTEGNLLRPAIIWLDTRAAPEAKKMQDHLGGTLLSLNGNTAAAYNVEPKLMWLRDHEPEIYKRAAHTLTTTAYITFRLSGVVCMNRADGGILSAYDAATDSWSSTLLQEMGLRMDLFPPIHPCSAVIGEITAEAADATGLRKGTPVVAGGEDTPAAALSMGVSESGQAFLSMGTAAIIGVCYASGVSLGEPRLLTYPHVVPGVTISSGSMSSAGASVEWLLREFGPSYGNTGDYVGLNDAVASSPPGANGVIFLPYLSGELHPILDSDARGVFFGLSAGSSRDDLARAVLEGSAMAIAHNLSVAEAAGASVSQISASGSPTRSQAWCQAIADITNKPLRVVSERGAPVGDALIAGAGVGLIQDVGETARNMATTKREYLPRAEYRARYDHMYEAYLRIYRHLADDFKFMAGCP
jgi:xylulokinase